MGHPDPPGVPRDPYHSAMHGGDRAWAPAGEAGAGA